MTMASTKSAVRRSTLRASSRARRSAACLETPRREVARASAQLLPGLSWAARRAAPTRNLDCEDRNYAYMTSYDGFNAGDQSVLSMAQSEERRLW
jgi:hypothetical protein